MNFEKQDVGSSLDQLQNWKIYYAITKVNYYQTVTPVFTNQGVIVGGVYIGETKKRVLNRSIEQLQLNIPKIVMGGLTGCTQKHLQNSSTYTNVK